MRGIAPRESPAPRPRSGTASAACPRLRSSGRTSSPRPPRHSIAGPRSFYNCGGWSMATVYCQQEPKQCIPTWIGFIGRVCSRRRGRSQLTQTWCPHMLKEYFDLLVVVPLDEELHEVMGVFPGTENRSTSTEFRYVVDSGLSSIKILIV